jgi:hypothetical protein
MLPTGSQNNTNNIGQTLSYTDIKDRIATDQKYKQEILLAYYFTVA